MSLFVQIMCIRLNSRESLLLNSMRLLHVISEYWSSSITQQVAKRNSW